ncbi:hypothetical protein LCGC14_1179590 [marine sediment metagenome]|uniref:Uncharacterized protein n=1 Tax=marine sediment metagenome TaxID=412755 RepID=A0A0F9P5J6_9ZZZZ
MNVTKVGFRKKAVHGFAQYGHARGTRRWSDFKRTGLRVWRSAFCWSYWAVAVTFLVALTWKLLTSGDFFLIALGVVFTFALCGIALCAVAALVFAWTFWPEIEKAVQRAGKTPEAIAMKLEDAPLPERIH